MFLDYFYLFSDHGHNYCVIFLLVLIFFTCLMTIFIYIIEIAIINVVINWKISKYFHLRDYIYYIADHVIARRIAI